MEESEASGVSQVKESGLKSNTRNAGYETNEHGSSGGIHMYMYWISHLT